MMTQLTITGPYINQTLFEQAGVAVPADDADWQTWAEAARQVAEATGTTFPMALDRSGHRLAGPAISMGAKLFDAEGNPAVVDDGFARMVEMFVGWHEDGTMAAGRLGRAGRRRLSGRRPGVHQRQPGLLLLGQLAGRRASRRRSATPSTGGWWACPAAPAAAPACRAAPAWSASRRPQHPEAVAKVIDFFAREDIHAELIARTKNVPAHKGLAEKGLDYPDASPQAAAALQAWAKQVPKISPIAYKLQGYALNRAIFNSIAQRVTQAIVGEMTVDEALTRITADVDEAVAQSKQ